MPKVNCSLCDSPVEGRTLASPQKLENRILEYVDHLHEHFFDPVVIRKGRYLPPMAPGYSVRMRPESLDAHEFPNGSVWRR